MNKASKWGCALAILLGLGRGFGGILALFNGASTTEKAVGSILAAIGLMLIISAISLLMTKAPIWRKTLMAAVGLFWVDGIVNGFLLYGAPQLSGQLINLVWAAVILILIRPSRS